MPPSETQPVTERHNFQLLGQGRHKHSWREEFPGKD